MLSLCDTLGLLPIAHFVSKTAYSFWQCAKFKNDSSELNDMVQTQTYTYTLQLTINLKTSFSSSLTFSIEKILTLLVLFLCGLDLKFVVSHLARSRWSPSKAENWILWQNMTTVTSALIRLKSHRGHLVSHLSFQINISFFLIFNTYVLLIIA